MHRAMAYAMDSAIELGLAFRAGAAPEVVAAKRSAVFVYSKAAADASKLLMGRYSRWISDV